MKPHPDCPDVEAWYRTSYEMAADRNSTLERDAASARSRAAWAEECAIVALRLLKDAGKLKPRTDDERAVVSWAENSPTLHIPGGNRRLAMPMAAQGEHPDDREAYIARATETAQIVLDLGEAA